MNAYHNIDCMEGMKHFPDKYFELAIVDPPYGIGNFQQSDGNFKPVKWNNKIPTKDFFIELERVSEHQIIWGANYYNCFSDKGGAIVWDKLNMHPDMSRCEIASCTQYKKVSYFQYEWHGYVAHREAQKVHPCAKPIKLYEWLLKNYAKQGDKILDTHVGSGSSIIAFEKHGFDYVGYEIDKDYYEASTKRILKHRELLQQEKIAYD